MKRWTRKPLAQIASVVRGVSFDKSQVSDIPGKNTVPILRAGNIQTSLLTDSDLVYVSTGLVSAEQRMRRGDLAICMSSGSPAIVGKTAHLENDWNGSVGAFCAIVRFNANLHHRFGSYWFRSPAFFRWRDSNAKGANIQNLRRSDLECLPIPVPPLPEQERIVKLLDEADELRKLRAQADHRTAALIPALFHESFGSAIQNPKLWPVRRLEEVVAPGKIVTYGIVQAGPNIPNGIPYIRTGDLKEGVIKVQGLLRTTPEIATSYRRSEVAAGDIVMSIRATVGTTAVVPQELDGANLTQGTARISPGKDIAADYLLWFLRMPETQSWIQSQVKGATFREITLGNLRQLPVLVPPLALQKEFAQRVTEIRELGVGQATSRTRLDALFQSMVYRAFNGEL